MHTLKSTCSVNPVWPVTPVWAWAGSVPEHSSTMLQGRKNYAPLWKRRKREVDSLSHVEGLQGLGWMRRCVVTHVVLHQITYLSSPVRAQSLQVPLVCGLSPRGTLNEGSSQALAFADVSVYKQLDIVQGQVAFQKLSTSTKICLNFNSLMPNAKGEKTKRVLLSSLQYFNNFTTPSGKKDCVNAFPHKAHTGGNWIQLTRVETHSFSSCFSSYLLMLLCFSLFWNV